MNVTLRPELERFVEERIRAGQFENPDDAINAALTTLREQETLTADDVAELRREIAIGIEQLDRGESAPWDAEALKERVRHKFGRKQA